MGVQRLTERQVRLLSAAIPFAVDGEVVRMGMDGFGDAPAVPRYKKDGKFLRGKNGRLFIDHDSSEVIPQHTGQRLFSGQELREWRLLLEKRTTLLDEIGIPYFHLVPPNAHSVYPEDLPDHIQAQGLRPVPQLIRYLQDRNSFAKVIYPLDDLLAVKPRPVYPKTDGHWSAMGAFVAYQCLADEMAPVVRMHRVADEDVEWFEGTVIGELGFKVEPQQRSTDVYASIERPVAFLVSDNCVINTGTILITECPENPDTTCVVLGDSFSDQLLPFLAASFGRLIYANTPRIDYDFIREHAADTVVSILNERFMIFRPADASGKSVAELEQEKIASGLTREPTSQFKPRDLM